MNTEYINLTEGTLQEGDEWAEWLPVVNGKEVGIGEDIDGFVSNLIFRRPIAISTSPFDSTNVSNEFEGESEKALRDAIVTGTGFIQVSHVPVEEVFKQDKPQEWVDGIPVASSMANIYDRVMFRWYEGIIDFISEDWCVFTASDGQWCQPRSELKFEPIKPEPTEAEKDLQCEIDMINAYLEQIDSSISDYDVQMFAQYVQDRLKGGDDHE